MGTASKGTLAREPWQSTVIDSESTTQLPQQQQQI
jgi:hypothetical protein